MNMLTYLAVIELFQMFSKSWTAMVTDLPDILVIIFPHFILKFMCKPGPELIKKISCSIQLSMKFSCSEKFKKQTIVGFLTFLSWKKSILGLSEREKC